nr:cytochrome b561 and DOMON domain-containing protein At3g07570-like [Quercus suber]
MKSSLLFMIFIITIDIYGLSSSLVNAQADSCSSNLSLSNSVPFDTTSLHCLAVWDSQGFILRYLQTNNASIWSFVVSAPADTNSYIAIGFSTNGAMVGSSAMVGWVSSSSNGNVGMAKQYYLSGNSPNLVKPDQGSLQLVSNSATIISQNSILYMAFQLQINQPESQLLYAVGPTGVFPSAPDYQLSKHRTMVSTSINYAAGQSASESPYSALRRGHGILAMLGWGILMIIGTIVARYFKHKDPIWFYLHISLQSVGFILGVIGVICGFFLNNHLNANVGSHKSIGIFILLLGCIQGVDWLKTVAHFVEPSSNNWNPSIVRNLSNSLTKNKRKGGQAVLETLKYWYVPNLEGLQVQAALYGTKGGEQQHQKESEAYLPHVQSKYC